MNTVSRLMQNELLQSGNGFDTIKTERKTTSSLLFQLGRASFLHKKPLAGLRVKPWTELKAKPLAVFKQAQHQAKSQEQRGPFSFHENTSFLILMFVKWVSVHFHTA